MAPRYRFLSGNKKKKKKKAKKDKPKKTHYNGGSQIDTVEATSHHVRSLSLMRAHETTSWNGDVVLES